MDDTNALDIGSRRELLVDHYLIDSLDGAELVMSRPRDEGIVFRFDRSWEGQYSAYAVVLNPADGDYYLYYRASPRLFDNFRDAAPGKGSQQLEQYVGVALSRDGINWERPDLGLHEVHDTRHNNVILVEKEFCHSFSPFVDKPGTPKTQRFKSVAGETPDGLVMFSSEDGLHWEKMFGGQPVFPVEYDWGSSPVFWSETERQYILYGRTWKDFEDGRWWKGFRWVGRSTSEDLEHWTRFEAVRILHDGRDIEPEHFYTNGTQPYFRAPHIYIALFGLLVDGGVLTPDQIGTLKIDDESWPLARSGGGLMSSRGGKTFQRTFLEEFIRPPIGPENWICRCNYPATGIVQTGPAEMSVYTDVEWGQPSRALRRYSLRLDGFASLRAPFGGGQMVTKAFTFEGNRLSINYATGSRGSIRIQIETPEGRAIEGFAHKDCLEIVGNETDRLVAFRDSTDVGGLSGRPVRLRVVMKDADLYSFQFMADTGNTARSSAIGAKQE